MMKRGKDEDKKKKMGPLFPRLHVKDTEKGGPRAPPRNKMALYEQLSVPYDRFNPAILPLKQNKVSGYDRNGFTSHHLPTTQSFFPEKSNPSESSKINAITSLSQIDRRTIGLEDDYLVPTFTHLQKNNDPKHGLFDINTRSQSEPEPTDVALRSNIQEKTMNGDRDHEVDTEVVVPRRSSLLISEEQSGTVQLRDERSTSDASIVDSSSALEISPDEVVALIGPKRFWKARRVILNQQRLFAMQVFELHRLIKVQKLIAENPPLFSEDASTTMKPPLKTSEKASPGSCTPKCSSQTATPTPTQPVECSAENAVGKPPPPGPPPEPWICQTPPAAALQGPPQWLVPVMSPTEGLIYKPCLGPTGFMPPSPVLANYMNPVPLPCFQMGLALVEEIPRPPLNPRIPKEFDLPGSTPNSPIQKEGSRGVGTFKLFAGGEEQPAPAPASRVIKAVPHNMRSASESVARIIRSLQEERNRQYDNV